MKKAAGRGWVSVVAGLTLAGASSLAAAAPTIGISAVSFTGGDFIVNPQAVGETQAPFSAGGINFEVTSEIDQFNGSGTPSTPSARARFNETGSAEFSAFVAAIGGRSVGAGRSGLGLSAGPGDTTGYSLYALFGGEGESRFVGSPQGPRIQGIFETFNVAFYVDRDNDTTFDTAGPDDFGFSRRRTGGLGDDVEVLNGRLLVGDFSAAPGLNSGSFAVLFRITGFGSTNFFSTTVSGTMLDGGFFNGVNTFLSPNIALPPSNVVDGIIAGSGNVSFGNAVPEPGSLALVGLALVGAGLSRRKRRG